jgi:hypothetical protein
LVWFSVRSSSRSRSSLETFPTSLNVFFARNQLSLNFIRQRIFMTFRFFRIIIFVIFHFPLIL